MLRAAVNKIASKGSKRSTHYAAAALSTVGNTQQRACLYPSALAAAVAVALSTTMTLCGDKQHDVAQEKETVMEDILAKPPNKLKTVSSKGVAARLFGGKKKDEKDDKKYENLPDEDEDTNCLLCKIYRQGPCRPYWRKFEYCVKDQRGEKDTGDCDKFVLPFEDCWKEHLSLYELIALDANQIDARDIELDYRYDKKEAIKPKMEWTAWVEYLKEEGSLERAVEDCAAWRSLDKFVPLWKRFVILEKKPFLLTVSAAVPRLKDGKQLKAVYALDQDGLVAGFSHCDDEHEQEKAKKERKPVGTSQKLDITLVPGMTKTIQVKALYAENSKTHPEKKDYQLDSVLCVGPEMSLEKVASTVVPTEEKAA